MALQSSGAISLADIQTEFGGSNPIAISEYYGAAAGVPASGAISISSFYGKSNTQSFTISTDQTNLDLRAWAVTAGWDQSANLEITIGSGVYIYSTAVGTPAMTIAGSFPSGVTLINNGFIVGDGGNGGIGGVGNSAGSAGGVGGLALSVSSAVTIANSGTVAGGGGGGGGGGGSNWTGEIGDQLATSFLGGGGGGGGRSGKINSSGGAGGAPTDYVGAAGSAGTVSAAGGGGGGGSFNGSFAGAGGTGGNWGTNGNTGGTGSTGRPGGAGGSSGAATSGNANITWSTTGTRLGALN